MIKCSECGKSISTKSIACPNCGNPTNKRIEKKKSSVSNNPLLIIPILILLAIIIFTIVSCSNKVKNNRNYNRDIQESIKHNSKVSKEITDYIINSIE